MRHLSLILLAGVAALALSACVQNRTFGSGLDDVTSDVSVKTHFAQDGKYNYSDLDITVYEGRILLTGTMLSHEGAAHAEYLASKSQNAVEVINEIMIGPKTNFAQGASDIWIDEKLGAALLADGGVVRSNYQIAVSNGIIYLLGLSQGPEELERAVNHARTIRGVQKVVSHVIYIDDERRLTREM